MTSIVIVGIAKSGTSALYAAVKATGDWLSVYEIANTRQVDYLLARPDRQRVTKILLQRQVQLGVDLSRFDRQVYITRDPRDLVVSWLLYRPLMRNNKTNRPFLADYLAALRRKEADPRSVSIADLHAICAQHDIEFWNPSRFRRTFAHERRLLAAFPAMHVTRYEDFLDGEVTALSGHLGLDLPTQVSLGGHIEFNERAKQSGGWRHWFTPADVATFRGAFADQLARHGYDPDWSLAADPVIDPATSSGHVERHLRREHVRSAIDRPLGERHDYTPERVAMLRSAVADGREAAMVELAVAGLAGFLGPRDPAAALELISDAAARGDATAMVHRGLGARHGVEGFDGDPDSFFRAAAAIRGSRWTKLLALKAGPLWEFDLQADAGSSGLAGVARRGARRATGRAVGQAEAWARRARGSGTRLAGRSRRAVNARRRRGR